MGWEACCWTDDALSNKKIHPTYQFPARSKNWLARVRSSEESMRLMVRRVQDIHEHTLKVMRKSIDAHTLEVVAERAAAVVNFAKEVQHTVPVTDTVLEKEWLEPWAAGSEHIDMEVASHVMDKYEGVQPAQHVPTLKRLVDAHLFQSGPIVQTELKNGRLGS